MCTLIVSTHFFIHGPSQDFRDYLVGKKIKSLLFISHPLFYEKTLPGSGFDFYEQGTLRCKKHSSIRNIPWIFAYVSQFFLNIFYVLRFRKVPWDVYVGYDNLNAVGGVLLKKMGLVKKTIYYVIDYHPKRFKNPILNRIYHFLDQYCVRNCDETWNVSPRMEKARLENFGFSGGNQKLVPMGVWLRGAGSAHNRSTGKRMLVYSGWLAESKGVQHIICAIPEIVKKVKDFKFVVIGKGYYKDTLVALSGELGVSEYVDFLGYIPDQGTVLRDCTCAVALYEKCEGDVLSYTYYGDPAKLKTYLSYGLPVIMTDVPYNSSEIEKAGCGVVVTKLDPLSIAEAVVKIMSDDCSLKKYREDSFKYISEFSWEKIFSSNLKRVLG